MSIANNYILFDDKCRINLLPLTFTRPVAEIRTGILTIREKWDLMLKSKCSYITEPYLSKKFPLKKAKDNILINGSVLPNSGLIKQICSLKFNEVLMNNDIPVAIRLTEKELLNFNCSEFSGYKIKKTNCYFLRIEHSWDIFTKNGDALIEDFKVITKGRQSAKISKTNRVLGKNIFIEKGATVECAILNSYSGPIYIGKDAEIMEGSIIRGPFAIGEHSVLKLGAKIYGPTTIGPFSKAGGEVNNSVIFGFSNKAHDGFLGNSVIGEWCNIGADSNNSNLKNNYDKVKLWSYAKECFVDSGLQFCGLIMGDHSKCGINTMFNTGTVVGVSANIFGAGFPRNFIPSFSWGGAQGMTDYKISKAIETAERVYERRGMIFNETEKRIFRHIYEITGKYKKD
ncbi:MAG: GlmU family protein [Bacteroidia bacterium]|nr:GlmU family protein [Bacteroidia bacterium]